MNRRFDITGDITDAVGEGDGRPRLERLVDRAANLILPVISNLLATHRKHPSASSVLVAFAFVRPTRPPAPPTLASAKRTLSSETNA
jgi:hypothetical protein